MFKTVSLIVFVWLYQFPNFFGKPNPHNLENGTLFSVLKNRSVNGLSNINDANDTLHLVVEDDFLFYPFGSFDNIKNLQNSQPKTFIGSKKLFTPYKDNKSKKEIIYYLNAENSYLGTFLSKDTKKYEIVSSIILNNQVSLKNGISVGITKEELFKAIKVNPDKRISTIDIVQVESPNKAINHYYRFADNKLAAIVILSEHFSKVK